MAKMKTGGSSEQSMGDGWSERQGWVHYDGVALGSQRVACLQPPSSQLLDPCQHNFVRRLETEGRGMQCEEDEALS